MRETVFGKSREALLSDMKRYRLLMAGVLLFALILNAVFLLSRNDANHEIMLGLNVAADTLAIWFAVGFYDSLYRPRRLLLALMKQQSEMTETHILSPEGKSETRRKLNCLEINTENGVFYLPRMSTIALTEGERVILYTVSGIITEVQRV